MIPARISPAAANDLLDIADYLEQESFAIALGRAWIAYSDILTPLAPQHKIPSQVQSYALAMRLAAVFPIPSRR